VTVSTRCRVFCTLLFACAALAAGPAIAQPTTQPVIVVRGFRFVGNTVFSDAQLNAVADPILARYPGGRLDGQAIEQIRNALTLKYVDAGYINSGAILPRQTVGADGILVFKIVQGRLTRLHITFVAPATGPSTRPAPILTRHFLDDSYLTSRIQAAAGTPLNVLSLKNRLALLQENPNIESLHANLKPAALPGESELDVSLTERNPFQFGLRFANDRSPSVGAYRLTALASDTDVSGHGDELSAQWDLLEGSAGDMRFSRNDDYSLDYSIPLTPNDLTLLLHYARSSDLVIEAPFSAVDITSVTDDFSATLRQPLQRDLRHEWDALFTVSSRYNRTFLLGSPFSFAPGADNGVSDAFALRFGTQYTHRSAADALAVADIASVGIDGPNATLHGDGQPDSRFFSNLSQIQYLHRLPLGPPNLPTADTQGLLRLDLQLTPDQLLDVEQFSLGGVGTVRGYRENQLVTDNAVNASAELRVPLAEAGGQPALSVIPFFDSGYGWNTRNTVPPQLISSVGVGLAYTPSRQIDARIYWGIPFKHFSHQTTDLQDMGLHFSVTIFAF
jgi:hemolysin activation/secretion protein